MALPLGKLAILVGAGIFGSVLAKEGRLSDASNFVSGAFKIVLKQVRRDDSSPSASASAKKPPSDALLAQVNSLRQELQLLARDRTITIVNASGTGARKYGTIIVVVVVGYGYIWWKGWRLPDMMFASRRSLSDACTSIAKQLENVYASIAATKRKLSSRMDGLDSSLDECAALTEDTREEVSVVRGRADMIGVDVKSVHFAVRTLETKISRIEEKQDLTNDGVKRLCDYAWNLENSKTTERIEASPSSSSRPALELPPVTPSSRATASGSSRLSLELPPIGSLPPDLSPEPPSPSYSYGSQEVIGGISEVVNSSSRREVFNRIPPAEVKTNGSSSSGLFGLRLPGISAPFLTRTRSATNSILQHSRSSSQQA
ncbi:BZIP transcription factor, putative (DUF1664) [Quillaja saponaria]|uniref:BZIP transcription factor, putative (DUF1664) n=1 Tax=Quillaja saponaria TaxID=32244 RepID=A0AAD7LG21_QUISA|nr:BZIP transcription factor, putative (DUF1664) [Quillaja saponaria]